MNYILFNPLSNNSNSKKVLDEFIMKNPEDYVVIDVINDSINYEELTKELTHDDEITIVGGDGTLNHFINDTKDLNIPCDIYMLAAGTGMDFFNDIKCDPKQGRVRINEYLKDLPTVTVNGKDYLFINGVGYGIDGYCCETADKLKLKTTKPINYTSIAIKGLLFHYKAPNAIVTVDGVTKEYKRVWLAPTMKGKYYGGGMIIAPNQDRKNHDKKVSLVVMHKSGKLKTLMVFPSIFKGEHVSHTEMIDVLTGSVISVKFNRPTALQIDGETISNVEEYTVRTK